MQMADHIAEDGFKKAGYEYVCIDVSEKPDPFAITYSGTSLKLFDESSGLWRSYHIVAISFCQSFLMLHLMYISGLLDIPQSHFRR